MKYTEAFVEGYSAYFLYKGFQDNPYPPGSDNYWDWENGFVEGRAVDNGDSEFNPELHSQAKLV